MLEGELRIDFRGGPSGDGSIVLRAGEMAVVAKGVDQALCTRGSEATAYRASGRGEHGRQGERRAYCRERPVDLYFAMDNDGLPPLALDKVHPKHRTPHVGTICAGIIAVIAATLISSPSDALADYQIPRSDLSP